MADVDVSVGVYFLAENEKVSIICLKKTDDLADLGNARPGDVFDLTNPWAAAGDLTVGGNIGKQEKEMPGNACLFGVSLDLIPGGIGVAGKSLCDAPCHVVVDTCQLNRNAIQLTSLNGELPGTHESMLHQRKLVREIAGFVDDTVDETLLEAEWRKRRSRGLSRAP